MSEPLSIGQCAQIACILDATARKPGNVNRFHDLGDLTYLDFLLSAVAIGPAMEQAPFRPVGVTVLEAIKATRRVVNTNTNLGIVLLLAPLASVPPTLDLRGGVNRTLCRLTVLDAKHVYEAIRLAKAGGLGSVPDQDVGAEPTKSLREVMALAAERDLVARQYVNDFEQVFEGLETLTRELESGQSALELAIIRCFLQLLSKYPDSLVERKHGWKIANKLTKEALKELQKLEEQSPDLEERFRQLSGLPLELIGEVPFTVNPGTTADLVTAALFVALRRGTISLPLTNAWAPRPCDLDFDVD